MCGMLEASQRPFAVFDKSVTQPLSFWDTGGLLVRGYLHPGKTTIGQHYAEPTFKLLDVIKQKY